MVIIYFSANAYLIDAFPDYVASALAAKTVVRSGMGAAMPLFIVPVSGLSNHLGKESPFLKMVVTFLDVPQPH